MRLSVVRLIFNKEVRDLIRDRRTVMLIVILPAVLYPLMGGAGFFIAQTLLNQKTIIGIVGAEYLPDEPKLFEGGAFRFEPPMDSTDAMSTPLAVLPISGEPTVALRTKKADVALVIPAGFAAAIADPKLPRPTVTILSRDGDEKSKLAAKRLVTVVNDWQAQLREQRFAKSGLPKEFDRIFTLDDPLSRKPAAKKAADELRDTFVRTFPFILIMFLVSGAIQPAVDTTAGERERGTMETLLISPASRREIVVGKWAATTLFGFASVIWNVIWLAGAAFVMELVLGSPIVNLPGLFGCVVLGLPLAMLFAALAITLGIFAKSTKEGQYYLIPLMLLTMPLAFWSMIPGNELTPGTAVVPVTGAMLFQQKLLSTSGDPVPWELAPVVLGSLAVGIGIALVVAIRQFNRESVLFRESAGGGLFSKK
jgi:sodium transport system permease protein